MNSGPGFTQDPSHKVVLEKAESRWRAVRNDEVLAETAAAMCIREDGYPPVIYFPPADVRMDAFEHSDKHTYCPFKGDASYLSFDGVDIAWCYAEPYDEVAGIKGFVAFYSDQADVSRVDA